MSFFDIIYPIVFFILTAYLTVKLNFFTINNSSKPFVIGFLIRGVVGVLFAIIYSTIYSKGYSNDTFEFFKDSKALNNVFLNSSWEYLKFLFGKNEESTLFAEIMGNTSHWSSNSEALISDSRNLIRFHSLIHFISFNNYYIHIIVVSYLSTIGIYFLSRFFEKYTLLSQRNLFYVLIFFPSLLFWTSGILKEPFVLLGLGLVFYFWNQKDSGATKYFYLLFGFLLLIFFKTYVLLLIVLCYLLFEISKKIRLINPYFLYSIICLFLLFAFTFSGKYRDLIVEKISTKQIDFNNLSKGGVFFQIGVNTHYVKKEDYHLLVIEQDSVQIRSEVVSVVNKGARIWNQKLEPSTMKYLLLQERVGARSRFEVPMINNSYRQLLKNIPLSIRDTLFRPFITDNGGVMKYPSILETILLAFALICSFVKRRDLNFVENRIIATFTVFILLMCLVIGLVTPISGAIVRYRIFAYLAILLIIIIQTNFSKKWQKDQ